MFIDYKLWADKQGIVYSPFSAKRITTKEIEAVAKDQGVEFKQGDIFIIRSGFTDALGGMTANEQEEALGTHQTCGVEGTEDSARWFWNHHFTAVAGDAIAFETIPPINPDTGKEDIVPNLGKPLYFNNAALDADGD